MTWWDYSVYAQPQVPNHFTFLQSLPTITMVAVAAPGLITTPDVRLDTDSENASSDSVKLSSLIITMTSFQITVSLRV